MPKIEYRCPQCGNRFEQLIFRGDPSPRIARCPRCKRDTAERIDAPEPVFDGIAGFSTLAKDTN